MPVPLLHTSAPPTAGARHVTHGTVRACAWGPSALPGALKAQAARVPTSSGGWHQDTALSWLMRSSQQPLDIPAESWSHLAKCLHAPCKETSHTNDTISLSTVNSNASACHMIGMQTPQMLLINDYHAKPFQLNNWPRCCALQCQQPGHSTATKQASVQAYANGHQI